MAGILANDTDHAFAADDATKFAKGFHRRTDSHMIVGMGIPPARAGEPKGLTHLKSRATRFFNFSQEFSMR